MPLTRGVGFCRFRNPNGPSQLSLIVSGESSDTL